MLPEYEKHSKYSFEDANVAFIVEDRVKFDIHRHFLQRDSKRFSAMLTAQSGHPDGIYRVSGLKVNEFESLLDFFYEGMYQVSPADTPMDSWVNLLSISTTMEFPRAREHAITAIDICASSGSAGALTPARVIQIANTYGVEKWLEPAYEALAERVEMIDEDEAEMIGMKGVLVIMRERESRLRAQVGRIPVSSGVNGALEESDGPTEEVDEVKPEQVVLTTGSEDAPSSSEIPESTSLQMAEEAGSQEPALKRESLSRALAEVTDNYEHDYGHDDEADLQVEGNQSDPLPRESWEILNNKLLEEIDCEMGSLVSPRFVILMNSPISSACNKFLQQLGGFNGPQSHKKLQRLRRIEKQAVIGDDEVRKLIQDDDQKLVHAISVLRKKRQGEFALESYMHSPSEL
ncbi:hypothetical protein PQX77_006867 [Marasmius sp. AFHP31]|nr:hypothetical protein PQX77_006867 [Marasmius sp. AFHP31]